MRAAAAAAALAAACLVVCRPAGEAGTAEVGAAGKRPQAVERTAPVRDLAVRVVASYPHDPGAYTQGLELGPDGLFESAGRYGESSVRRVDLPTGRVLAQRDLPRDLFAEGLTVLPAAAGRPARVVQLTWQEGRALVWGAGDLEPAGEHDYGGEGWGLCLDEGGPQGPRLVMSDGSGYLTFRDPETFAVTGGVPVTLGGAPLAGLNELECVAGAVWANVYPTDRIVEIEPATGRVTATVDASGLLSAAEAPGAEVLNGIAHDPADGTFLVTGKLWPRLFRIELVPR